MMYQVSDPWTEQVQWDYLRFCSDRYKKKFGCVFASSPTYCWEHREYHAHGKPRIDQRFFNNLYRLGFEGGKLKICYREFQDRILHGKIHPCSQSNHHGWYRGCFCGNDSYDHWYPRYNGSHFRHKTQQNITEPKVIDKTEQSRRDWRARKGFLRSRNHDQRDFGSRRKYCGRQGNRSMRRWERRQILKGDYEALADQRSTVRLFNDPWDWD